MPLSITDAERTLNLLWEFKQYAEDEESDTSLNAAISLLTGYCTEILPVITKNGVSSRSAIVELECAPDEKLGICLDSVALPLCSYSVIMVSLIKPASISDKSGLLRAGDQVLKINGHSLTGSTLRRARWLLETAQRSGKVVVEVLSSALTSNLKHSRTLPPSPFTMEPPPAKRSKQQGESVIVTAEVENDTSIRQSSRSFASRHSSSSSIHNHPSYAPSIGSRRSSQIAIASTVEVAAHIAREAMQPSPSGLLGTKKRKVHKIHLLKGKRSLGLNIIGGKGSKYGDVGIFIKEILVDGAAHRDGRLKVNDEVLMANGRSLVGMTHNEADLFLKSLPGMVQLVVATESLHPSGQTSMCSSRFSLSSIQERHIQNSISPLVTHTEQNSPIESAHDLGNESAHDSANGRAHNSGIHTSLEKFKDATTSSQRVPHQLLDTDTNEDGIISPQQKTFTTNIKHSEIPIASSESLSQFNKEVAVGKKNRKISSDSTDYAPKKEKSSGGTFKVLKIFKKNRSKANVHVEKQGDDKQGDDMEMVQLEMSLGKSLESETTSLDEEHKSLSPSGMSGDLEMVTPWARLSSSSLSQGNMPPSPPVKTIVIPRSQNKKLGIALGQSKDGSGLPFVKSLDPNGLAAKDGRVTVGNFIVKVNNQELVNHSAKDAASIIRAEFSKYGMVSLVISRGRKQVFNTSSIAKGMLTTVLLTNDAKFGLGLELAKLATYESDDDYDIVIQKVTSADNAKCVQRGDQILEVNGLSLVGIAIENVNKIFKRIKPGKVPLKLMRPANLTAVISELDKLSDNKSSQPVTSPLVNSYKENDNIESAEIMDTSHTIPKTPPSSDEQVKTSSSSPSLSVSHHSSTPDSDKPPVSLARISKVETSVNMSTEDILRRLHRHPSINTVKRELIEFEKGSSRMGVEVVAGDKTPHRGALVIRVFPDCIAGLEGKLKCGDEILEVSGRSIIGMTHSEVISLLKKSIGQVTMLVSRSSQVLNSHSGSETSLLDDFYTTEKLKSANTSSIQNSLDDLKSTTKASLHSVRQEEYSEDELDDASPAGLVRQSGQGLNDNIITIQYSDSSIFSSGHRTSVIFEENLPPLPSSSPPAHETLSVGSSTPLHMTHKEILKEIEDGPPVGYSVLVLEIQRISKGKLTIVPCQKIQEGYFMVRRFAAGNLKEGSIKPGDILVSLNGSPLYGIPHAQVLQSLNEAPKQSKLEIYRDPDYKLDSVYSPRVSYSRASYTGSRISLVSTDDSPQLESRKGSFTNFDNMSNRGSSGRSSRKLSVTTKRSSEGYEVSNSLRRYSSQEMSSPSIKQRPSSLSSFASMSTIVAKQSSSSVVSPLPTITPKCSAESSPVAAHRPPSPIGYPINTVPSISDIQEPAPLTPEDAAAAAKTVGVSGGDHHDVPMETFSGDQAEKVPDTNLAVAETKFIEKKKPVSILFGSRSETGPFVIEVTKGFWGLGMTVDCDKIGAIFVKALTSRSPLSKDGNIKVGDRLLSINDEPLKSLVETEQILKRLPKGPVKIVAMPPPPTDEKDDDWSQYILSPSADTASDKGIITVEFNRPKSIPLGLNIAGGSDMPQTMVYIHSITPGSLADRCNKFRVGDEIVMVGNDLMVGLTWKAASDKINQLVGLFKIVAQRREIVAKLEEKHQEEEIQQNGSDSFESDSDDKSISGKKELLAPVSTNTPKLSTAAEAAAAKQHSEDNKVTPSVHPEQLVMPTNHMSGDESITFTVMLNRPKNISLGLNIAGGSDMLQKAIYIHSITPGSLADKCNKFKVGDEIVMAGNTTIAGLTWKSASAKVNKLVGKFKIVAKRRNGSKQQQRSPDDFPDGPQIKAKTQHQDSFDGKSEDYFLSATAPELPSNAPPELPSSAPPKPSSSPPGQYTKLAQTVSVDSFDSESGDELILQQESGVACTNIPLQNTKPAHAISMDSFDSESGDEELLLKETISIPPNPPPRVPPEPLPVVTKPAQAISMDSFDSESGDESLLEQEDTLGAPPDPPHSAPPDPPSSVPPDPPSSAPPDPPHSAPPDPPSSVPPDPPSSAPPGPPHSAPLDTPSSSPPKSVELVRTVSADSFDSESGDELLLQEMLGVPPKPSSAPPKPPPRVPPKSPKLDDAIRTKVHQHKQSDVFDDKSGDEFRLEQKAAKLSKNSVNSESDDESTFVSQKETFTVVFNKDANMQLGISIKEDIDTTNGVGIRGIKKDSLADRDGRLQPGNKLLSVNEISLCGLTYKKTLEVLRNAGNELKIIATRPAMESIRKPVTCQSSIDELSETSDNEEPPEAVKVGEEKFTVEFHKEGKSKLGVTITGGIDTPTGDVGIKNIVKGSLADKDGKLQQGDKLLLVNGISLSNVTNREALEILRGAGNHITIVAVRYVGVDKLKGTPLSSAVPSLTSSRNQSPRASRKALHDPIPEIPTPRRKMSKHFQPGTKSTSSLHESGHHTLPRDFGTVKAIELRKGAQGLGMQLIGGIDVNRPVTVKEVFQGGAAHQSSKIRKGDQILEINGKSFAQLTHREVIELVKNEPEGKVTLLVKFASRNK